MPRVGADAAVERHARPLEPLGVRDDPDARPPRRRPSPCCRRRARRRRPGGPRRSGPSPDPRRRRRPAGTSRARRAGRRSCGRSAAPEGGGQGQIGAVEDGHLEAERAARRRHLGADEAGPDDRHPRGAVAQGPPQSATASSRVRRTCTPSTPSVPGSRRARPPVASTTPSARTSEPSASTTRPPAASSRDAVTPSRSSSASSSSSAGVEQADRRPRRRCRRGTPSTAAAGRRAGARRRRRAPAVRRSPRRAGPRRTGPRRRTLPRSRWSSCGLLVGLRYWGVARGSRACPHAPAWPSGPGSGGLGRRAGRASSLTTGERTPTGWSALRDEKHGAHLATVDGGRDGTACQEATCPRSAEG